VGTEEAIAKGGGWRVIKDTREEEAKEDTHNLVRFRRDTSRKSDPKTAGLFMRYIQHNIKKTQTTIFLKKIGILRHRGKREKGRVAGKILEVRERVEGLAVNRRESARQEEGCAVRAFNAAATQSKGGIKIESRFNEASHQYSR